LHHDFKTCFKKNLTIHGIVVADHLKANATLKLLKKNNKIKKH
jgi:hypothetical protein